MFGPIQNYKVYDGGVKIFFENRIFDVEIINENTVHIFENPKKKSYAVKDVKEKICIKAFENDGVHLSFGDNEVVVQNDFRIKFIHKNSLVLNQKIIDKDEIINNEDIDKSILKMEGHQVLENTNLEYKVDCSLMPNTSFYGLGDKTGFLNKRGYEYENWNTDNPAPHVDSFKALYKSIPFVIGMDQNFYGIFLDSTYKTVFNLGKEDDSLFYFGSTGGSINYYFFFGNNIKDIVREYTNLTGRCPMPQEWTLGYHQSRWSYASMKEVLDLVDNFEKNDLPLDVVHLDIDYMDSYKVFTVNDERFNDFKGFIKKLKEKGIKIVTIIDPGVKVEKGYFVYEEGLKNDYFATKDQKVYHNVVWPGDSVYPSFTNSEVRAWWGGLTKILTDLGVSGIWNDMNEPASFNGPLPLDVLFKGDDELLSHKEIHNVYGHNMAQATYEGMKKNTNRRPFIITRACYSGTQKYSTLWTGDNHSIWAHLQMAIPQQCNLGLSGYPFIGTDIGGFGSDTTKELLARWIEVGAFSPLFRNHSAYGTRRQEPYQFDKELVDIYRKYENLRYTLIPYFYDLFYKHQENGLPIIRPLVLEYPNDKEVTNLNDEFMLGDNILVSPVVEEGKLKKMVYLPEGGWIDYFTKKHHEGGKWIIKDAPLDVCPIFIKENTMIPLYANRNHFEKPDVLILDCYGEEAVYVHYEDNGEDFKYLDGEFNLYSISFKNNEAMVSLLNNGYQKGYKKIIILKEGKEITTINM